MSDNGKAINKIKELSKKHPYSEIKLKVHEGQIRNIETTIKERLDK
ncbi:MAG: hypothetical protein ACOCP8_07540 [archaeon]